MVEKLMKSLINPVENTNFINIIVPNCEVINKISLISMISEKINKISDIF